VQLNKFKKLLYISSIVFFINGCNSLQVVDLKPEPQITNNINKPTNLVASIETKHVGDKQYSDSWQWEQGLANVLRDKDMFKTIIQPDQGKEKADIIIKGEVGGVFHYSGTKNFFTWWPGAIFFAHSWRGTRYSYDTHANYKVTDAYTGELLGEYHAETSHELVHSSGNPGHMLGALIVIPGVIKGATSISPRQRYRQRIYKVVYPSLWEKISAQIIRDLSKRHSKKLASIQMQCAEHLDETPKIGMVWDEFTQCQTRKYRMLGEESQGLEDSVAIYVSYDRHYRIHVAKNGRIVRWYVLKNR